MQRFTRRLLSLEMGFCMIPHPDKVYKGGEDGAFLDHRLAAFGVADGVGGYADSGIDPAVFARLIMSQTAQAINEDKSLRLRPELAIQEAYRRVAASKIKGGCTALVAILEKDQRLLRIANLGDSGLLVLRENLKKTSMDVVFRTKEQQHYFNCPFQLGYPEGDSALEASTSEIEIEEGDILIAATDGVLDNMFDQEIAEITLAELQRFHQQSSHDTEHSWIQRLAVMIASEALRNAFDPSRTSPFQKNAQLSGYRSFTGGKVDDITVISARISE